MRTAAAVPLLLVLSGLLAAPAFAQSEDEKILGQGEPRQSASKQSKADDDMDDEELDDRVFYSGFGIERATTPFDNLGAATNLVGVLGFRIPTAPWFGIEIDLGQTLIPGENKPEVGPSCGGVLQPPCAGSTADTDEFAMQALGLSLALKSSGPFYVTGKYGYRYLATSIDELNENRSGNGFAVGVGYRWGRGLSGVELAYKQLAEDVDSIGLTFFVRAARR